MTNNCCRPLVSLALVCAVLSCASPPPPAVMARVSAVRVAPASVEAQTWAPQAYAHGVQLEAKAGEAVRDGDSARAEALAEHAIAAFEHARALTRLARAERRRLDAEAQLAEQRRALAELHAQHQRSTAEAAGLELRERVVRGALPLPPHEATEPERQRARQRAAGALATQGRLLCMAARLLGEGEQVQGALARLDQLDRDLTARGRADELETATELRSQCLRMISAARRKRVAPKSSAGDGPSSSSGAAPSAAAPGSTAPASAAPISADQLLTELSEQGAAPSRDDRGVSVVLRDLFDASGALTPEGRQALARLAGIAKAHPDFPVLVVHHAAAAPGPDARRRLETVEAELASQGLSAIGTHDAGQRTPLLASKSPEVRQRNERIELIFVAPGL